MRSFLALVVVAVLCACGSSNRLADGTMIGTMTTGTLPVVSIDGQQMRLAPGARIVNASNTSITPNQVPAESRVRYKLDASGQVSQVWLLPASK
jgi:hypothetical protein